MKILFIAPKYSGGIGGHAKRVADKLQENGFEVELMYAPHIPIKKLKNPTFAISSVLKAITERKTYDIVHAFNLPSAFAMKYTKAKKKVLSIHGVYSEQIDVLHSETTSTKVKNNEMNILKWADKLLTNSKNVPQSYKKKLDLDKEISVVLSRSLNGVTKIFPVIENQHKAGILDLSIVPARVSEDFKKEATAYALDIANNLNYVGTIAVEFFISENKIYGNEIAPRPHNSGHFSLDACNVSQFDQQVLALIGRDLEDIRLEKNIVLKARRVEALIQ